jgi:cell division protein ZapA (FtsZ GTPase activity inhibitor)
VSSTSIKLTIAGRTYPLTVEQSEEEAVLKAAERINATIKNLQENYAVRDIQDLLAMSALQLLVEQPTTEIATSISAPNTAIESLEDVYSAELKEIEQLLNRIA